MDRVNQSRKLLPVSLLAFAMVTLLSVCQADVPDSKPLVENVGIEENSEKTTRDAGIQQAVGVLAPEEDMIQQVVGKQSKPRKTRPGLLQVLAGSKPKGDANHQHENMSKGDSKGLLDVLFNKESKTAAKSSGSSKGSRGSGVAAKQGKSGSSKKSGFSVVSPLFSLDISTTKSPTKAKSTGSKSTGTTSNAAKTASNTKPKSTSVDWDGIPYHSASVARQDDTEPQPMRDPSATEAADTGMRIIRGGARTITAKTASTRKPMETDSNASVETMAVPRPPRDIATLPASRPFSNTSSSRRSNRRTLQPLSQEGEAVTAAKTASLPKKVTTEPKVAESEPVTEDLIPRVARRTVQKKSDDKPVSNSASSNEVATKNASNDIESDASQGKPETRDTAASKSSVAEDRVALKPGSPRVVQRRSPAVNKVPKQKVPSQEIARREVTPVEPSQVAESQTAVAAIGAPLVAPPAELESGGLSQLAAPKSDRPSVLKTPGPVIEATSLPEKTQVANVPSIKTFPTITSDTGSESESRFPQPVLAPKVVASSQPSYTVPVAPAATKSIASAPTLGPPAAAASHRAGPPGHAFESTAVDSQVAGAALPESRIATSLPVGSGIATNIRTPLRTNGVDAKPQSDPYALSNAAENAGSQAVTPSFGLNPSPLRQPISRTVTPDTFRGNHNRIATNFNRSSDSRNMMRSPMQASDSTNSASELPGIRVATFGPSEVTIRQVNEYEIRVENRGAIDARGVIVRASIPDWADMKGQNVTAGNVNPDTQGDLENLVWTIDRLPAGTSEKMFIRLMAARSGSYGLGVDWTMQPQKSVAKVRVHEPQLELSIEGPDQVIYGMSQTYKVRVLNPGDGTAPNVVFTLSPNSATPQTQRIGDIPAGKEAQFDVELTAQDLGDLKIHGLASGDLELRSEASKSIRVAAAKLEAVLSGPQLKYQNAEAMYGLQLQNIGSAASENVIATLRLPAGVKYLGGMEGVVAQGNVLKWRLGSLKPGAMQNYQFRCQMISTGEHVFAFDCAGTAAGMTDVSIATRVESIADLVLTVSDPAAPAPIGSDVTYEILIRNRGSKEATNVRAVAQFGHGIEPKRIQGHTGEVVPGQVMFNPIPRIGAGAEVRLRVIAQAEKAGHHRFRAEVHSGDTMLVAEEATHYMSSQSDRVSRRSSEAGSR